MSPRRSSRARSSQTVAPPALSAQNSHGKADRPVKSEENGVGRSRSPGGLSTTRSESAEDNRSTMRGAEPPPRRSRRGNDSESSKEKGHNVRAVSGERDDTEEALEEDVTRCICGHADYPGPGASVKEQLAAEEPLSDDVGNFFVQCDACHVWQHGGCMGLTDETMLPDEYYCEKCRPSSHKIMKNANGTKSSRYLPVLDPGSSRATPLPSTEAPRRSNGKNKSLEQTKRRATMNSRGAYDEDEMLRRAIEESKEINTFGKRTRDETEDNRTMSKRLKPDPSNSSESRRSQTAEAEDDERNSKVGASGKGTSKTKSAVAKTNREKELREKQREAMAAQRAEAATKRNARSERRRGDDSPPPSSPGLSPTKPVSSSTGLGRPKNETPPSSKQAPAKKGVRPVARRGRLGRNQYTRDPPVNGETSDSPSHDTGHDRHGVRSPRPTVNGYRSNINGESGRSSKAKTHPARTSVNEMKRRVAAILEFVGRMQIERGVTAASSNMDSGGGSRASGSGASSLEGNSTPNGALAPTLPAANLVKAVVEGLQEANEAVQETMEAAPGDANGALAVPILDISTEKDFGTMTAGEMMETLTKELVAWQSVYGVYAR